VILFQSDADVTTGDCINIAWLGLVQGACPAATTADTYVANNASLFGPLPASGASVSNLEAVGNEDPGAGKSYTVEVIDNTTGSTVLSCSVTAGTKKCTKCTNTGSAAVTAGHFLEVKITNVGSPTPMNARWRVSFRY